MDRLSFGGDDEVRVEHRLATTAQKQSSLNQLYPNPEPKYLPISSMLHQTPVFVSGGNTIGKLVVHCQSSLADCKRLGQHSQSTKGKSELPPAPSRDDEMSETFQRTRSGMYSKRCDVCGDRARCLNFGGLTCQSCRTFFARSIRNGAYLAFRCLFNGCCTIDISTRKRCSFCRLKKCVSIGMRQSWIMADEEKRQFNISRSRGRQRQSALQLHPSIESNKAILSAEGVGHGSVSIADPTSISQGLSTIAAGIIEPAADLEQMLNNLTNEKQVTATNFPASSPLVEFRSASGSIKSCLEQPIPTLLDDPNAMRGTGLEVTGPMLSILAFPFSNGLSPAFPTLTPQCPFLPPFRYTEDFRDAGKEGMQNSLL